MIFLSILAVILTIFAGYFLRIMKIVEADFGKKLLLISFYITAPALFLRTLSVVELNASSGIYLIILLTAIVLSTMLGWMITRLLKIKDRKRAGSIVLASSIMNTGFVLPFAQSAFGEQGVAVVALGNLVVATSTFSIGYIIAAGYGDKTKNLKKIILKPLNAPPLVAIIIALVINFLNVDISILHPILDFIGQPTGFIGALALGILVKFKNYKLEILLPMLARYSVGLILVVLLLYYIDMQNIEKSILTASLLSPLGFNTVTLSSLEGLDVEYNATALSASLLVGTIAVSCAILFLG